MFNIKKEVSAIIENDLVEDLLFYATEYPEHREKIFKEFEEQIKILIKKIEKELYKEDEI